MLVHFVFILPAGNFIYEPSTIMCSFGRHPLNIGHVHDNTLVNMRYTT